MNVLSKKSGALLGAILALTAAGTAAPAAAEVQIRIVNLTRGQVFSPVIAWSHKRTFDPFFAFGGTASEELRDIAENGENGPMNTLLIGDPDVIDIGIGSGPIPPGGEEVISIDANGRATQISLASMLVNTNDTFFALRSVDVPKSSGDFFSPGFDAGTEDNNEDCAFIPGPACASEGTNFNTPDGGEGFIFVQEGIHGVNGGVATSDLDPSQLDWRNPVAYIEISRR